MKPSKIIKTLMVLHDKTFQSLADIMGKAKSTISSAVYRETRMTMSTFLDIVEALDSEVVVRTKDGKYEWVICDEDDSE